MCCAMKLQGTRKVGCPAHNNVIKLFPEFGISAENVARMGVRKLKERRSEKLVKLKTLLVNNINLKMLTKYFVLLPTQDVHHSYHKTSGEAGYCPKIHRKLVGKINELVSEGACTIYTRSKESPEEVCKPCAMPRSRAIGHTSQLVQMFVTT